jgi:hypothetical protein
MYGSHVHWVVRRHSERKQYFGTFFLRNRAELELMQRLVARASAASRVDIAVLACSKGAEVYSIAWALRAGRPDLNLGIHAVDISREILEFAERGVYSLAYPDARSSIDSSALKDAVTQNTCQDQNAPIFERMTRDEIEAMGEIDGEQMRMTLAQGGIRWLHGDALDPKLVDAWVPRIRCREPVPVPRGPPLNVACETWDGWCSRADTCSYPASTWTFGRVAREQGWAPSPSSGGRSTKATSLRRGARMRDSSPIAKGAMRPCATRRSSGSASRPRAPEGARSLVRPARGRTTARTQPRARR